MLELKIYFILHTLYNKHFTPCAIYIAHLEEYTWHTYKIHTACLVQVSLAGWLPELDSKYSEFDIHRDNALIYKYIIPALYKEMTPKLDGVAQLVADPPDATPPLSKTRPR